MARHAVLVSELEASVGDNAVRAVLCSAPRGAGLSRALASFVEEVRGWGHRAELTDAERVGVQPGGGLDSLLRARLGIDITARGSVLLDALDARAPDLEPLGREFLATSMGVLRPEFHVARLDARSRQEGAQAEVGRWLSHGEGAFAWVIDDALSLDNESLEFATWLVQSADFPGLVVLAVRDDEKAVFDTRVKALRVSGRMKEVALPSLDHDALHAAFPSSARASKGLALTARLLELSGHEGVSGLTLDAAVRELQHSLTSSERDVLGVVSVAGGRVPLSALEAVLGPHRAEVVDALERRLLVRSGRTTRCHGEREVWLRFPSLVPDNTPAQTRAWCEAIGAWAERQLLATHADPAQRSFLLPMSIRAAESIGDAARVSLAWELTARSGAAAFALRRAEASATGVRRLVLTRMRAEDELFHGGAAQAAKTAQTAFRQVGSSSLGNGPAPWCQLVLRDVRDELEQWETLTTEEASCALELARAEALSHLGQGGETRRAFEGVQSRLVTLKRTPATDALWLRLARTWAWFAAEMLADGALARDICTAARQRVGGDGIAASSHAVAFLRAEQIAHSRGGDPAEARRLADELIAVSQARGDQKEECVAWNARSLLSLRDGALGLAREGFERSLDLARGIGFRRREAVALHNLGLVLAYMGEYGASLACQEKYLQLSEAIGNHPARAYGPAAMALVYVQQLDVHRAEPALLRARRAAEENGWPGLIAWTRHLSGLLKLLRHLDRRDGLQLSLARADFLACLDLLEDRKAGWSEELDPAETAAFLALTWLCSGNHAQAKAALPRAEAYAEGSPHSTQVVAALSALISKQSPSAAVDWFDAHGYFRSTELWTRVAQHLELPVEHHSETRTSL